MIRDDLSDRLVHLTKGSSESEAAERFLSIVRQATLLGGTGLIRDARPCVCFSEAPISKLGSILAAPTAHGMPYAPFGVMIAKATLFALGGRPVIYQPDADFELLHQSHRYRHKAYEPGRELDFTWEREWRIQVDRLPLDSKEVTLVVPNRVWSDYIFDQHAGNQRDAVIMFDEDMAFGIKKCPWHFLVLEDLGIPLAFSHVP
jgi:hypothetical protein